MMQPGNIEYELGVPIPGAILPKNQWVRTALKKLPAQGPLDWTGLFGRAAPVVLDLGCGNGRFVLASALSRPDMNHLGLDILPVVIRYATRRGNQRGLDHVRFAVCGGQEFLERFVAPGTIAEIHVYHPQPYGDEQKRERRLVTPGFLALVHRSLAVGGLFVLQTDNSAYWRYVVHIAAKFFDFREQKGPWPEMPEGRSRREIIARRLGLPIFRGFGHPRTELGEEQIRSLVEELPLPDFDAEIKKARTRQWPRRRRRK